MSTTTSRTEGPRHGRVIHGESTLEIPVHLLFRDETGGAGAGGVAEVSRAAGAAFGVAGVRAPVVPPPPPPVGEGEGGGGGGGERSARLLPGALGVLAGVCGAAGCVLTSWWAGVLPPLAGPVWRAGSGLGPAQWVAYGGAGVLGLVGCGGLARGRVRRVGRAGWVRVRSVVPRRRADARLRHWRSGPVPVCDANGLELAVTVWVTWRVRDAARAARGVEDHRRYLEECVESALARVVPRVPVGGSAVRGGVTLRDGGAVGDAVTRAVAGDVEGVGMEVCAVRVVGVAYVEAVAEWLRGRRMAELEG